MQSNKIPWLYASVVSTAAAIILAGCATTPIAHTHKMTTSLPPGIASPDRVETQLGTLKFFDGFPDTASVEKL